MNSNKTKIALIGALAIIAVVLASGCVKKDASQQPAIQPLEYKLGAGDYEFTLNHGGLTRKYFVHAPSNYDKSIKTPLVMAFHGGGGNPRHIMEQSLLDTKSDKEGFIVVYPEGTGPELFGWRVGTWNAGECCGSAKEGEVDDVGFVNAMLDDLEEKFNIDTKRVYSTGHSNGALMTYRLACELTNRIAAIAPNGAGDAFNDCNPSRPIAIMHFHGTADPTALYYGGQCASKVTKEGGWVCGPIENYVDEWADRNGCTDDAAVTYQNGDVTCVTRDECDGGVEVTLCSVEGGGHTWPGGTIPGGDRRKEKTGPISNDISATDEMWSFFEKYSLE